MKDKLFQSFIVVAIKPDENGVLNPYIEKCFPSRYQSKLPNDIINFCFPEQIKISKGNAVETEFFANVFTSEDSRIYGFCKRFLPPTSLGRYDILDRYPVVYCFLSSKPYFSIFKFLLDVLVAKARIEPNGIDKFLKKIKKVKLPEPGENFSIDKYELYRPRDDLAPLIDVKLSPLVSRFDHEDLLKLLSALLVEKRLIFISSSLSVLSACVHAATSTIYPFKWHHIFIPILPSRLINIVAAPMPFFVGVPRAYLDEVLRVPREPALIVDLDRGLIEFPPNDDNSYFIVSSFSKSTSLGMSGVGKGIVKLEKQIGTNLTGLKNFLSKASEIGGKVKEMATVQDPLLFFMKAINYIKETSLVKSNLNEVKLFTAYVSLLATIFGSYLNYIDNDTGFAKDKFISRFSAEHKGNCLELVMNQFQNSQMFEVFIRERTDRLRKGYSLLSSPEKLFEAAVHDVKGSFKPFSIKSYLKSILGSEPDDLCRPLVLAISSNTPCTASIAAVFRTLATYSYNQGKANQILEAIWWRLSDSEGKNWKHGMKCLQLLLYLVVCGSEAILTDTLDGIKKILRFRYYENYTSSNRVDRAEQIRLLAEKLYRIINETNYLLRERSQSKSGTDEDVVFDDLFTALFGMRIIDDDDSKRLPPFFMTVPFDDLNNTCAPKDLGSAAPPAQAPHKVRNRRNSQEDIDQLVINVINNESSAGLLDKPKLAKKGKKIEDSFGGSQLLEELEKVKTEEAVKAREKEKKKSKKKKEKKTKDIHSSSSSSDDSDLDLNIGIDTMITSSLLSGPAPGKASKVPVRGLLDEEDYSTQKKSQPPTAIKKPKDKKTKEVNGNTNQSKPNNDDLFGGSGFGDSGFGDTGFGGGDGFSKGDNAFEAAGDSAFGDDLVKKNDKKTEKPKDTNNNNNIDDIFGFGAPPSTEAAKPAAKPSLKQPAATPAPAINNSLDDIFNIPASTNISQPSNTQTKKKHDDFDLMGFGSTPSNKPANVNNNNNSNNNANKPNNNMNDVFDMFGSGTSSNMNNNFGGNQNKQDAFDFLSYGGGMGQPSRPMMQQTRPQYNYGGATAPAYAPSYGSSYAPPPPTNYKSSNPSAPIGIGIGGTSGLNANKPTQKPFGGGGLDNLMDFVSTQPNKPRGPPPKK